MATNIPTRGYHEQRTHELTFIAALLKQTDRHLPVDLQAELQFRGVNVNDI